MNRTRRMLVIIILTCVMWCLGNRPGSPPLHAENSTDHVRNDSSPRSPANEPAAGATRSADRPAVASNTAPAKDHPHLTLAPEAPLDRLPAEMPPPVSGKEGLTPLRAPMDFSYIPAVVPGVQIILTRYLSFQAPDGRRIHARMFVFESNMKRVVYDKLDPDVAERRRALPQRVSTMAHEIVVPDPATFTADFDVPNHLVTTISNGVYEVNLGALTCMVRTVVPEK